MNISKHIIIFTLLVLSFSTTAFSQEDHSIKTVVIDAGHGGKDPGCVSKYGYEKNIALDVALKTGHYIEQNIPGVKVIYTRKTDVFIELYRRAEIANKANADLFISIHVNTADNHNAYGTETHVMGLDKTAKNLAVVKKENSVILQEDNYQEQYGSFNPNSPESYIIFSLYQNVHLKQSLRLAQLVQEQFKTRVGRRDRGVKQSPFYVLWKNKSPSILIELGFSSNPEEGKFLSSEQGRDYLASAIYRAFKQYKIETDGPLKQKTKEKKESKTPEKKEKINNTNIVFKVQFLSSPKKIALRPRKFKGLKNVQRYKSGDIYKYTCGEAHTLEGIQTIQTKVREKYADAFVVAFKNGKKISVSDALKEIKN